MHPRRRALLMAGTAAAAAAALPGGGVRAAGAAAPAPRTPVQRGRRLVFPRDHGAHLEARTEWWYATGWLGAGTAPMGRELLGFQITFFRSRSDLPEPAAVAAAVAASSAARDGAGSSPDAASSINATSRFATRHLLFAHAAITDLAGARHLHDQRIQRWNGEPGSALAGAALDRGAVHLHPWWLRDEGAGWASSIAARDFSLQLLLTRTQPLLLQGDAGFSRKGPDESQASHYYSEVQLAAGGSLTLQGRPRSALQGRAWMDHEWSEALMHPEAVGWDWIGINLFDGSALTAFTLRRRDGSVLWAGGSWRPAGAPARVFAETDLRMTPLARWTSPATAARYPVRWRIESPAGVHEVRALLDAQELDSRGSTGAIYWEGLSELLDERGRRVGLGYLEMTGYASPLKL